MFLNPVVAHLMIRFVVQIMFFVTKLCLYPIISRLIFGITFKKVTVKDGVRGFSSLFYRTIVDSLGKDWLFDSFGWRGGLILLYNRWSRLLSHSRLISHFLFFTATSGADSVEVSNHLTVVLHSNLLHSRILYLNLLCLSFQSVLLFHFELQGRRVYFFGHCLDVFKAINRGKVITFDLFFVKVFAFVLGEYGFLMGCIRLQLFPLPSYDLLTFLVLQFQVFLEVILHFEIQSHWLLLRRMVIERIISAQLIFTEISAKWFMGA